LRMRWTEAGAVARWGILTVIFASGRPRNRQARPIALGDFAWKRKYPPRWVGEARDVASINGPATETPLAYLDSSPLLYCGHRRIVL
jgi:hypothetical protein